MTISLVRPVHERDGHRETGGQTEEMACRQVRQVLDHLFSLTLERSRGKQLCFGAKEI